MVMRLNPSLPRGLVVLLLVLIAACHAEDAGRDLAVDLRPGMPALDRPAAPLLKYAGPKNESDAQIEPARAYHWLADDEGAFEVTVRAAEAGRADELLLTVWNWENQAVAELKLAPGEPQPVRFRVEGRGVYLLTLDGYREKEHVYRLIRSFAAVPANTEARGRWSESDYWLGICAFPGRYHWSNDNRPTTPPELKEGDARAIEAELTGRLGLTVARLDVSMVLPQKPGAAIDWRRMDAAVQAYTSRGFELALQLMHPPDWSIDEKYKTQTKDRWRFPRQEEAYRRYVREIVARYGKRAKFVQVNNEPDQVEFWPGEPREYVQQFEWAKEEIERAMPEAKLPVVNGGYAFIDSTKSAYYVEHLKGKVDRSAYHSHGNLAALKRDMTEMRALHAAAGYESPRYINTECGYAAWRLDHERTQAASAVQKVLYSWANGDEGMLLFVSRMTKAPETGSRGGRDFGFMDYNFCPRFVYGAVAAFVETIAGATFERTLIESDNVHAYLFKRGGQRIVAVFAVGESRTVTITSDAKAATVADAMGNHRPAKTAGAVAVTARAYPQTVVLEGASGVKVVE